jgi:hypothetical protein
VIRYASLCCCALAASWLSAVGAADAQLRDHGGPVCVLVVSPDGEMFNFGELRPFGDSLEGNSAQDVPPDRLSLPRGSERSPFWWGWV